MSAVSRKIFIDRSPEWEGVWFDSTPVSSRTRVVRRGTNGYERASSGPRARRRRAKSDGGHRLDGLHRVAGGGRCLPGLRIPACGEHRLTTVAHSERRGNEPVEQRVRSLRSRLELRVELARHEPRVVLQLDDLDETTVGRLPGQGHAGRLERLAVAVVDLEAVAMPLVDDLLAIHRRGP